MRPVTALLLACTVSVPAFPSTPHADNESRPVVAVRIFNYARVDTRTMNRAREHARRIVKKAGLQMTWQECGGDPRQRVPDPPCGSALGANEFAVRVLERFEGPKGELHMGQAAGRMVNLYWEDIRRMAEKTSLAVDVLLGCALVHELGHLLLHSGEHSSNGLMATGWGRQSLVEAERGNLLFSEKEAALLRLRCGELERAQAATPLASMR